MSVINGELQGDVFASERVELAAKARVLCNVHYRLAGMKAGAILTRRLIHLDAKVEAVRGSTLIASNG